MKRIFLFLLVNVFVHMCSINTMAQMRPTFGTNTDLHNVEGNVKIIFGFNSGVGYDYGEKAFFLIIIRLSYKLQIQDFLIFDLFGIMKLAHSIYLEVIQPMHQ